MSIPPDLMASLMGAEVKGPEQTAAVARQLRGDSAVHTLAQLSGDPILQKFGKTGQERTTKRTEGLRKARAAREQRELTKGYYDQLGGERAEKLKFEREQQAALEQYRRDSLASAKEVASLKAAAPGKILAMPQDVRDNLVTGNASVEVLNQMRTALDDEDFNPGSTGVPGGRSVANLAAQYGVGTEHSLEAQQFWREYNRRFNLLKRNELFGATLTANEQRSWKSAVAGEEMNKEQLKEVIGAMARFEQRELNNYSNAMQAQGRYSNEAINILTPGLRGYTEGAGVVDEAKAVADYSAAPGVPSAPGPVQSPGGVGYEVISP